MDSEGDHLDWHLLQLEREMMSDCLSMIDGHGPVMWVMGSFTLITLLVLLLAGAALAKYLFSHSQR
jgi:hypothetical protein